MSFGRSMASGITGLMRFQGRDRPGRFWPYAGVVIVLSLIPSFVGFGVAFAGMFAKMQKFAAEHPEQTTVTQGPGSYSIEIHGNHPELMPDFDSLFGMMGVTVALITVFLAAAVARRLHDRGLPGWMGLIPLSLLLAGFGLMHHMFDSFRSGSPDLRMFFVSFLLNAIYLASLGWLIYHLASDGQREANRYGEAPEPPARPPYPR